MDPSKRHAPATRRNREPILSVLREALPERGRVLEIAAGSGEHAVYFSRAFPHLEWQPTDADPTALASIAAWRAEAGPDNLLTPLQLDVTETPWPVASAAAVICVNMIHISPWACSQAMLEGAARVLPRSGVLYLYGPYKLEDAHTAPSNARFDAMLKARDPRWGVRDLDAVIEEAARHGLDFERRVEMPANNQSVLFRLREL